MAAKGDISSLPNDVEELKRLILDMQQKQAVMETKIQSQDEEIGLLKEEVQFLRALKYARKSEKWTTEDKTQMLLFNEMEQLEAPVPEENIEAEKKSSGRKKGRKPIPDNIPREEVIHELSEEEKCCPHCSCERPVISREETEEFQFIPARLVVNRHICLKYGPCSCDKFKDDEELPEIIKAKAPPRILPGSIASSGLLSYTLTSKFCDGLPFNRMERIFRRVGVEISRTNMANWAIKAAKACEPLVELMRKLTREGPLINMDETTTQVLKEPGRKPENKSYMWVTVGSIQKQKIILFNYSQTRKEEVPLSLLDGFHGILQTDGYAGYNKVVSQYDLWHVGCLAHAKRKFNQATSVSKKKGKAESALTYIRKIYRIEKDLRKQNLDDQDFVIQRRKQVIPVWKEFHKWLRVMEQAVPPKSKLGEAVSYTLNEYRKLVRYMKYACATPDNNIAENAIRPFVIGRKNWLFSDTPKGAYASAVVYSLVETAKANGIEPQEYLYLLFEKLPLIDQKDDSALEGLLPWNIKK